MDKEIEFDQGLVHEGQWTEGQRTFIKEIMGKIESALQEKFPNVADNVQLTYEIPEKGIGAKIKVSYSVDDELYLGELQTNHLLQVFAQEPETSNALLQGLLNDHASFLYEKVITRVLIEHLNNLISKSEQYVVKDVGTITQDGKVIVPSGFVPENKILMHPNTLEKLKKEIGA